MLQSRLKELEGLRGVAIVAVVAFHFAQTWERPLGSLWALLAATFSLGWIGVDIFFALSGFFAARELGEGEGGGGGGAGAGAGAGAGGKEYLGRRLWKILPLYYFCLTIAFVQAPSASAFAYLTLVQNFWIGFNQAPGTLTMGTWALALLVQCWLALPWLVAGSHRLPMAILLMPLARWALRVAYPEAELLGFVCRADAFFFGCLLARYHECFFSRRLLLVAWTGSLLALACFAQANPSDWKEAVLSPFASLVGYPALGGFGFLTVWLALRGEARKVLCIAPLQWLGRNSYPIFLFHQGIHGAVHLQLFGALPRLHNGATYGAALLALGLIGGCAGLASAATAYWNNAKGLRYPLRNPAQL